MLFTKTYLFWELRPSQVLNLFYKYRNIILFIQVYREEQFAISAAIFLNKENP